ncbi:MAG TPA: hypothetical protein VKY74_05700, partial [Chloroflexia bacterium]|nr:hypothetical protein [Chloroflexia bacterium]
MSTQARSRPAILLPALPIERYRGIAAVLLAGLLVIAALAPLSDRPLPAEMLLPPPFDGQPVLSPSSAIFDYPAASQRVVAEPPPHNTILREPGLTTRALRAIAAHMLVEDTGPGTNRDTPSPAHPASDEVLMGGPARWSSLAEFFTITGDPWAANGMGVVESLRASASEGPERDFHQRKALYLFNLATDGQSSSAAYRYNWALLQLAVGHYGQAAAGFNLLVQHSTDQPQVRFFYGVALLRAGEPAAADLAWQPLTVGPPTDWTNPALEGRADAQAAIGNGPAAVAIYQQLLGNAGSLDWGIYEKLVRLEILQGGAPRALDTIADLLVRFPDEPRLHYDQGRLLLLLGRTGPALGAFQAAIHLQADDPALHAGFAAALLAAGDPRQALAESDAAIKATGGDPAQGNLSITYSKLDNTDPYQRSVGQALLNAHLVRAQALALQGQPDAVRRLAGQVEAQGAGGDVAKAAWFRYYAGLLYAAGGLPDEALSRLLPAGAGPAPGPSRGTLLLAWVRSLPPAAARAQLPTAVNGDPGLPADAATAAAYFELARKLEASGPAADAAPFYRAAAAWEAGQETNRLQPLAPDGTERPIQFRAAEADYLRRQAGPGSLAGLRYQQVLNVVPADADAHTNRGILLNTAGDSLLAQREFELAARVDPANALAAHNLGVLALRQGPADLGTALADLALARQAAGPAALQWRNDLIAAPQTGGLPGPWPAPDYSTRLPALAALVLLLLHTLIPARRARPAADDLPDAAASGLLGRLGERLTVPVPAIAVLPGAILVAGLAWAWALSGNSLAPALALLPLTLLAAIIAIAAQEGTHRLAVRFERQPGTVQTGLWPLGLLLTILGAPLGLLYGWVVTTRAGAQPGPAGDHARAPEDGAGPLDGDLAQALVVPAAPPAAPPRRGGAVTAPAQRAAVARTLTSA